MTLIAGARARPGFYFNRDGWDLVALKGDDAVLPGHDGQRFVAVPALAVLVLAPMFGALFVLLSPFVALVRLFGRIGRAASSGLTRAYALARRRRKAPRS